MGDSLRAQLFDLAIVGFQNLVIVSHTKFPVGLAVDGSFIESAPWSADSRFSRWSVKVPLFSIGCQSSATLCPEGVQDSPWRVPAQLGALYVRIYPSRAGGRAVRSRSPRDR